MAEGKPSNTAHVILGFLAAEGAEPKSGYDLKQMIDKSVRFFFAASYGQIYPELKKLSAEGLIEGTDEATGGRARTTWVITEAGRGALRKWLLENENRAEMRDQGILRSFFADTLSRDERIKKLRELREQRIADLAVLQALDTGSRAEHPKMPDLILDYGLGLHEYVIAWCDRTIKKLEEDAR
jgi:DNA-binding PadR family transcriptional regulator